MCSCTASPLPGLKELKQSAIRHERHRLRNEHVDPFRLAFESLLEEELRAARQAARDQATATFTDSFYPELRDRIIDALRDLVVGYATATSALVLEEADADVEPVALEPFAEQFTEGAAARWTNDSVAQVRQITRDVEEDDQVDVLLERFDRWEEQRAQLQAEREATQGAGAFATHAMIAGGVARTVWVNIGPSCPLCTRMEGRTVDVASPFMDEGETLEAEGDDGEPVAVTQTRRIAHPPLHGGGKRGGVCDCLVAPA